MALNLLKAGFTVGVHSRSPGPVERLRAAGAVACATPRDVVASAEVVCTCLPDEDATRLVYLEEGGLLAGARDGTVLIETSTIGPGLARELAAGAAEHGAGFLDAPISGGTEGAEAGSLTIMAGGEARWFEAVLPVLRAMGSSVHHVGSVGQGNIVKLTNQALVAVHTVAALEALLFGQRGGADPAQLLDVLKTSWGSSGMLVRNGPVFISRDFGSRAPVRLLAKDLSLIAGTAADLGLDMPLVTRAKELYDEAVARGLGETDIASLITVLEAPSRS